MGVGGEKVHVEERIENDIENLTIPKEDTSTIYLPASILKHERPGIPVCKSCKEGVAWTCDHDLLGTDPRSVVALGRVVAERHDGKGNNEGKGSRYDK